MEVNKHTNHPLNRSSGKYAFSFGKSKRPKINNKIYTDTFYQTINRPLSRSTTFGIGDRQAIGGREKSKSPSPNKYNIRSSFDIDKFDKKGSIFGLGRQHVKFNSFIDIKASSQIPPPNTYILPSSLNKSKAFSIRKRIHTDMSHHKDLPGPGQYYPCGSQINPSGKYCISAYKNINSLSMDTLGHTSYQRKSNSVGPGQYNLPSTICAQGGKRFFPKQKRPEPHYKNKTFIPGPGRYDIFSQFLPSSIEIQK